MRRRYSITLASKEPIDARLAILITTSTAISGRAIRDHVESRVGTHVVPNGERAYEAYFTEPLELVVAARALVDGSLSTLSGGFVPQSLEPKPAWVRGLSVSAPAHELLADAKEPTASAWQWVLEQLGLRSAPQGAFVAAVRASSLPATDRSLIALQFPVFAPGVWSGPSGPPMTRLFDQDRIVIGRADDADIQIVSDMVSRRHCRFERRGREWYVMDMGSSGGTFLDEERVDNYRLETGDRFRFGVNWVEVVAIL